MSTYRNYAIEDTEAELIAYRARNLVKVPRYAGQTYTEVKAKAARHRRLVLRWAGWIALAMIVGAFAVHVVGR